MNWKEIEGHWHQAKGRIQEKWGELTDDDLDRIQGKREQLIGKLREKTGRTEEEIERELAELKLR
jgi:uncharacterized protein YjbJ (UPF0337 family)